jgi:hypothetical protein
MQCDVIHLTSEQVDASRRPLGYVGEESTILELLMRMRLTNSVIRIDEERDGAFETRLMIRMPAKVRPILCR